MNQNISKIFGSILMLIGTAIGAGMLALPMVSALPGFSYSIALMLGFWILAIVIGFMIIEINLAFPKDACTFSSMAKATLGIPGSIITWLAYLFLLYAATAAYITGESSLISSAIEHLWHFKLPVCLSAIIFTCVLGSVVFWSTRTVDFVNRGLISIKGALLALTLFLIMPHINFVQLIAQKHNVIYLLAAAPIFFSSFCYHFIIPSIRIYIGDNAKQLCKIVIIGTTTILIIYILWVATTLGTLPLLGKTSFTALAKNNASVGEFTDAIAITINHPWITVFLNGFSNITMTTSFLGVTLGLFDFLADGCKRSNTHCGRLQTSLLTFIPPLIFALYYPKGFLLALNYASIFVAILVIILPAAMMYCVRKNPKFSSPFRLRGGNGLILIIMVIGIIMMILPILGNLHLLPALKN